MPRGDGTGPMGTGPMGGGGYGRGYCRSFCVNGEPGYLRNNYLQNSNEIDEKEWLIIRTKMLENQLKNMKERLSELEKESK